jgi:hypothetical protein
MSHIIREIGASILWKFDLQDTFQTIYWYRYRSHDYNVLQFHTNEFSNCFNTCSNPLCYNLCCPPGVQWELVCSISLFVRICDIQYNAISIVVLSCDFLFSPNGVLPYIIIILNLQRHLHFWLIYIIDCE